MLHTEDLVDLGEELWRASFHVSTQQILAAQQVLDTLREVGEEVPLPRLRTVLAPIFCTTPDEQRTFASLYQEWSEKRFGLRQPLKEKRSPPAKLELTKSKSRRIVLVASGIIFSAILSWLFWQEFRPRKLTGRVIAKAAPLDGARVTLGKRETRTDADGQFVLSFTAHELPGDVVIVAEGHASRARTVDDTGLEAAWWSRVPQGLTLPLSVPLGDIELSPLRRQESAQPVIQLHEETGSQVARIDPLWRLNASDLAPPSPWWGRLAWTNMLVSLLPITSWLLWTMRRRRRRPALQRLTSHTPSTLREVVLHGGTAALLPSVPLRRFAQSLRRRRHVHSAVLDTLKTVEVTTQRGGLFLPIFGSRVEPEYLVLVDRTSVADHQAQLALQVVTDLVKSDVLIDQYEFDGDPTMLRHIEGGAVVHGGSSAALVTADALHVTALEELLVRTPTHRLLLFCAPSLLFDGLTGLPRAWVEHLTTWEERFIFTPEPPEHWGRAEWILEKLGFSIIPLSRAGFLILTEVFQSGTSARIHRADAPATKPLVYKRTVGRWLERRAPTPDVVTRLCEDLQKTLGSQGFLWLAACAAYPEIHWGFTLRLGVGLFSNSGDIERLLPLLTPLVWLREAFIPDWLREALLQRLTPSEAEQVRRVLMDILSSVGTATTTSFSLRVATDETPHQQSWWTRLRNWASRRQSISTLIREAPEGSPLQDYVFVRFLSRKRLTALTPTAPRTFLRVLFPGGYAWLGWRPWVSLTACLMLSGGLAARPFPPLASLSVSPLRLLSFTPDSKMVAFAFGESVIVTDIANGKEVVRVKHAGRVYSIAMSPDSRYAVSGSHDNTARVWELATGKEVARMTHNDLVETVAISPDGRYVVSGSRDNTARVWELTSGKELTRMTHEKMVNTVAVSPDSRYVVSGSSDNTARVWELTTGKEIARMTHDNLVEIVAVSPDSRYVISGSWDNTARVWELATGQEIARMTHGEWVHDIAVSPNNHYVVSGSDDNTARVSELSTGKEVTRMTHDQRVRTIAISPDSRYVVSGSRDKTARVSELATGQEMARLMHDHPVTAVAMSLDGRTVASVSRESLQLHRFTPNAAHPRAVAFLVGNNDSGAGNSLAGPIPDVRAVAKALERLGFQVFTFENASQQQIRQAFADLTRQLRPDDRLLVFLSGQGTTSPPTRVGDSHFLP
jgi:Caspase domain/WD domain, G-beta repeat